MKNSFDSGNILEGKIEINGMRDYRRLRVCVDARVVGWLKIQLTDCTEANDSSSLRGSFLSFGKGKTIEYKNNRRIFRYINFKMRNINFRNI